MPPPAREVILGSRTSTSESAPYGRGRISDGNNIEFQVGKRTVVRHVSTFLTHIGLIRPRAPCCGSSQSSHSVSRRAFVGPLTGINVQHCHVVVAEAVQYVGGAFPKEYPEKEVTYPCGGCAGGRHRIGARRERHRFALFDARTGHKNCQWSPFARWGVDGCAQDTTIR
jgi:hypothetical protein